MSSTKPSTFEQLKDRWLSNRSSLLSFGSQRTSNSKLGNVTSKLSSACARIITTHNKSPKKVRFHNTVRVKVVKAGSEMTDRERRARWLQPGEIRAIRREARSIIQQVQNSAWSNEPHRLSYEVVHMSAYESAMDGETPPFDVTWCLNQWTQHEEQWRGLEKYSMTILSDEQHRRTRYHVCTLVRMHRQLQYMRPEDRTNNLRRFAESISLADQIYALAVGRADAEAAMAEQISSSLGWSSCGHGGKLKQRKPAALKEG